MTCPTVSQYQVDTPVTIPLPVGVGGNDHRNDFKIYLLYSNVAKLEFEFVTPGTAVRHITDCAMIMKPCDRRFRR